MGSAPPLRPAAPALAAVPGPRHGATAAVGHALPWAAAVAAYFLVPDSLALATNVLVMVLLTLSLDLVLGYAGIVTLGHAVFFGAGAYAAGIFAIHVSPDPVTGLLVATAVTGAFGLLCGLLILHTEGVTLLMLTLAIASLVAEVANQAKSWTGGDDGLQGMTMGLVLGLFRFDLYKRTAYLYSLAVLFVWFVIAWRVVHSPFGRSLDGIRQSPARMRAIGTPVWGRLVVAYGLSAAMAGSAGALSAQTTRFVGLNTLSVMVSGMAVVMLVLGGTRRLYGAFIGAALYVVVQDVAAQVNPFYWMLVIGLLLMVSVLALEGGLMSLVDAVRRRLGGRREETK
ncbi:branched-chain amino acid ABC transporter permease [Aquabacterium sp. J223]|uniref:branched-chain amino acid ABC transporter permease n=1 Tax=Aquabacterium sp. J223 TaxID=2898431 RepID=UPI0021AD9932|nr:branched-chain amino acid ABC transporter permease [Aquabacterium sp. J223]UUX94511.1 branched-chain amino acid ABC transporter permease [Aquabacterium sp. J223]